MKTWKCVKRKLVGFLTEGTLNENVGSFEQKDMNTMNGYYNTKVNTKEKSC